MYRFFKSSPNINYKYSFFISITNTIIEYLNLAPTVNKNFLVMENLLRKNWKRDGYENIEIERESGLNALALLKNFYKKFNLKFDIIDSSILFEIPERSYVLNGKIDLLEQDKNENYIITNFKLNSNFEKYNLYKDLRMLFSVFYIYLKYRKLPITINNIYIENLRKDSLQITLKEIDNIKLFLENKIGLLLNDNTFSPISNSYCNFCEFNFECLQKNDVTLNKNRFLSFLIKTLTIINGIGFEKNKMMTGFIRLLMTSIKPENVYVLKQENEKSVLEYGNKNTYNEFLNMNNRLLEDTVRFKKMNYYSNKDNYIYIFPVCNKDELYYLIILEFDSFLEDNFIRILQTAMFQIAQRIYQINLFDLSVKDKLTEIYNNYYFKQKLYKEIQRTKKYNILSGLFLLDIDHFKRFNDNHGHLAGDYVLHELAKIMKHSIRNSDICARYGGEEFVFILSNIEEQEAIDLTEKFRKTVQQHNFKFEGQNLNVTISGGLVLHNGGIENIEKWIKLADDLLYKAKDSGRNNIKYSTVNKRS